MEEASGSSRGTASKSIEHETRFFTQDYNPHQQKPRGSGCGRFASKKYESIRIGRLTKSRGEFACVSCGYAANADLNAAKNILAAGHAVMARGASALGAA